MAISISRFSSTFFVSFLDWRDIAFIAAIECGGGGNSPPLCTDCLYSSSLMPLYTDANEPDPSRCCNTYPAATFTLFAGGVGAVCDMVDDDDAISTLRSDCSSPIS